MAAGVNPRQPAPPAANGEAEVDLRAAADNIGRPPRGGRPDQGRDQNRRPPRPPPGRNRRQGRRGGGDRALNAAVQDLVAQNAAARDVQREAQAEAAEEAAQAGEPGNNVQGARGGDPAAPAQEVGPDDEIVEEHLPSTRLYYHRAVAFQRSLFFPVALFLAMVVFRKELGAALLWCLDVSSAEVDMWLDVYDRFSAAAWSTYDPRDFAWMDVLPDGSRNIVPYVLLWWLSRAIETLAIATAIVIGEWRDRVLVYVRDRPWLTKLVLFVAAFLFGVWLGSILGYHWPTWFPQRYTYYKAASLALRPAIEVWGVRVMHASNYFDSVLAKVPYLMQPASLLLFTLLIMWGGCWLINRTSYPWLELCLEYGSHVWYFNKTADVRTASNMATKLMKRGSRRSVYVSRSAFRKELGVLLFWFDPMFWLWGRSRTVQVDMGLLAEALSPRFDLPLLSSADLWARLNDLGKTWALYNIPAHFVEDDVLGGTIYAAWEVLTARRAIRRDLRPTDF